MSKPIKVKPSFYAYVFYNIKEIAKKYGYNLVLHGSMDRDLDLIAIPWEENVGGVAEMMEEIALNVGGNVMAQTPEEMNCFPHGRTSWVININRGGKFNNYVDEQFYLDISVIPTQQPVNLEWVVLDDERTNLPQEDGRYLVIMNTGSISRKFETIIVNYNHKHKKFDGEFDWNYVVKYLKYPFKN